MNKDKLNSTTTNKTTDDMIDVKTFYELKMLNKPTIPTIPIWSCLQPIKPKKKPKSAEVFNLLVNSKVIFNEPATILIVNNGGVEQKMIAKSHEEDFDQEKGLLVCIAKYFGVTYQDIKRLLGKAKTQK